MAGVRASRDVFELRWSSRSVISIPLQDVLLLIIDGIPTLSHLSIEVLIKLR